MVSGFNAEVYLEARRYPAWPSGFRLYFFENGGRRRGECFSISLNAGKTYFNFTAFNLRLLSYALRFLPSGNRGRGHSFGWPGPSDP